MRCLVLLQRCSVQRSELAIAAVVRTLSVGVLGTVQADMLAQVAIVHSAVGTYTLTYNTQQMSTMNSQDICPTSDISHHHACERWNSTSHMAKQASAKTDQPYMYLRRMDMYHRCGSMSCQRHITHAVLKKSKNQRKPHTHAHVCVAEIYRSRQINRLLTIHVAVHFKCQIPFPSLH